MGLFSFFFGCTRTVSKPIAESLGSGDFGIEIVGEASYHEAISEICGEHAMNGYDVVFDSLLITEDSNPHDKNAVRVVIAAKMVGYLSREHTQQLRKQLRASNLVGYALKVNARVRGGSDRGDGDVGLFGVCVDLPTNE